ncbi:calmin [Xyrichtys novacula]|nr:calmin [Xyrichtys novacula]
MRDHSKAIKKLLQWVQKRTRKYGVAVQDFGRSWTSGLAFLAVIKSIDSSLVDMRKALLRTARENLEDAFRIAHYSLGIPRLLEAEDVTINAIDEQSIIIYVSQFLEHFPGNQEDEHCQLTERSVSMCRLNYGDANSEYMRNSTSRSRVRERSYMFERDFAQPPPKILISSMSEDRSSKSLSYRVAAARSWSSEDILADTEELSRSEVKDKHKKLSNEASTNSASNHQQLTYSQSPSSSLVPESFNTESAIGDSAISSPDSWVESELGVTPEKFSESCSDGSLCDSGTAWDIYRATPVEITTMDDVVPLIEDKTPDEQSITESYIDEEIYSLSSMESTLKKGGERKQEEVKKEGEAKAKKTHQEEEQVTNDSRAETENEPYSKQIDMDQLLKEQEQFPVPCNVKTPVNPDFPENDKTSLPNPIKSHKTTTDFPGIREDQSEQSSAEDKTHKEADCEEKTEDINEVTQNQKVQINGMTKSWNVKSKSEEVKVETECVKTESTSEETKEKVEEQSEVLKEEDGGVVKTEDKASEKVLSDSPETPYVVNLDRASETGLTPAINIPVISVSSEPEEQEAAKTCDKERQDPVTKDKHMSGSAVTEDASIPQNPDEWNHNSNTNEDQKHAETSSGLESANAKPPTDVGDLEGTSEHKSSDSDVCPADTKEQEPQNHEPQTHPFEKDLVDLRSSADFKPEPVNKGQEANLTDQPSGLQGKLIDVSLGSKTPPTQQTTSDGVSSKPDGLTGTSYGERGNTSKDTDLFSADLNRNSPTNDLLGDPVEPMDLFYPDKEDPMFTEPPDSEIESWPSVLSVSALQPAPASETLSDDQPLILLEQDIGIRVDTINNNDKSIPLINLETSSPPMSPDCCLLKKEGLWGGDVPADCSDLHENEDLSPNTEPERTDSKSSIRPDEVKTPPVLRHRKGARLSESLGQTAAGVRDPEDRDSAVWWADGCWELYLLLVLWLLLYCFWLLPQMDLKTLPSVLLNL